MLLLNIGLGYALIQRHGALGAAAASSICYLIATIGYTILYTRVTGLRLREVVLPQPGTSRRSCARSPSPDLKRAG
ncbi:hypothetical protein AB5I41_17365 [Sphingomonas sp. MMS24-JH45]